MKEHELRRLESIIERAVLSALKQYDKSKREKKDAISRLDVEPYEYNEFYRFVDGRWRRCDWMGNWISDEPVSSSKGNGRAVGSISAPDKRAD